MGSKKVKDYCPNPNKKEIKVYKITISVSRARSNFPTYKI